MSRPIHDSYHCNVYNVYTIIIYLKFLFEIRQLHIRRRSQMVFHNCLCIFISWGQILGGNPDKRLKSFPPCYSKSPLQLCIEISISWNSRNLLQFLGSVKEGKEEKRGKTDSKPYLLPYGLRNLKSEDSQDYAQKPQEMYVHEFGICKRTVKLSTELEFLKNLWGLGTE
jgi:hypothetical protein